jgi:predicted transcriptional regulator of viral defense system
MKLLDLEKKLKQRNIKIFSTQELKLLLDLSEKTAQQLVWRYKKKGYIFELKKGLYALKTNPPNTYQIANRLYQPSYISFDAALSYYGIIPETIYTITSATTRVTREFVVEGICYSYHHLKKSVFTGYKLVPYLGVGVNMAEPEKALADYLYYIDLHQRSLHYERIDLKKVKKTKLKKYLRLFKRPGMFKLMEKIYAEQRKPPKIY